ncbi:Na+/H+ antiporter [Nocardioides psychrotolerans]|uniref:Monovalent cation:H+ antiporter, CPA1 family n=1 Tax=Nocardioides psychrotolerans TaxID=1005945 RepID=A0A1I3I3X2_9ACTN|nr:Na+/H+ antiporter [Nocardioides psychrotolerans]GEP38614.1 Na+/H+ antiporter [Nocardioides psychrotolerans]SFI42641.1 monovalent cation:H+ antiporter, CPA1 family [Nocardioides psychrotolerans]
MEIAFFLVALSVGVLAVTALAERIDVPPPLLLIAVGVAASYAPGMPEVHLEAEVVLLGLLPPLLYATAIQTSLVDFNANRRSILLLSVGLVVFTTAGIGALVHVLIPGIGWPAAFAIGAVVAPPDAVAATAIARRIGLPRRIVTILEGESLLNDATALVSLRTAIAAGGLGISTMEVAEDFLVAAGGGVLVGFGLFVLVAKLRKQVTDPLMDTAISLVVPFAAYILAEEIHASGVISVVIVGLLLGHQAPVLQTAQSRIAERMNWRTIAFVLENTVFLLIGLQAKWLFEDVGESELSTGRIVAVCAATLAGVIVLRMVWVFMARYLLVRPGPDRATGQVPPWPYTFILGWAGMRGVVTLAAAFIIDEDTEHREVLLLIAFTVVAGTLFIQGLTLPWLARRFRVPSPDPMDDALARATLLQQASKAGFEAVEKLDYDDPHGIVDLVRQRIDQRNFAAWERLGTTAEEETPSELYARIRLAMLAAERSRILEIRSSGTVASEVVADVLAMLDIEESMIDNAIHEREDIRGVSVPRAPGDQCDELLAHPVAETVHDGTCARCLEDGTRWVALRQCLECGHVGCCDSSPGQHATEHFHETTHPVMQSGEPGEDWRWCFLHHLTA